jgi:hypothetical protein
MKGKIYYSALNYKINTFSYIQLSLVTIRTRLRAGQPKNRDRFRKDARNVSHLHPELVYVQRTSHPKVTDSSFTAGKAYKASKLPLASSSAEIMNSWSYISTATHAFKAQWLINKRDSSRRDSSIDIMTSYELRQRFWSSSPGRAKIFLLRPWSTPVLGTTASYPTDTGLFIWGKSGKSLILTTGLQIVSK